jgi:hypothetical protein
MALEREYRWYQANRLRLLGDGDAHEGKYVVVKGDGDDVLWPLDTYEAALEAGYDRHGLTPFFVQQVERHPRIIYETDLGSGRLPAPGPIAGPPDRPGLYWVQAGKGTEFGVAEVDRYLRGWWLNGAEESDASDGSFPMRWITAHAPISFPPPYDAPVS